MVRKVLWISLCILLVDAAVADLRPDPDAGRKKSEVCVACHNADGNSTVPAWPKIAGQPEKYFIEQLKAFKKGEQGPRFDANMYAITQALTDQDIADLAAYFASQKATIGTTKQEWLVWGEKIYRGGNAKTGVPACGPSCHGMRGEGNAPAGFPRLSGQHPDYMIEQLKRFKNGTRSDDPNGIMRDIAKQMTEEEIQAVSNYVSGLH
jgi:cytochrome c553